VGAAVTDFVAVRLDAMFVSYPPVRPMADAGNLRNLAVAVTTQILRDLISPNGLAGLGMEPIPSSRRACGTNSTRWDSS